MGKTYYDVLDVSRDAGEDAIKDAYRLLASMLHPDKYPSGSRQQELAARRMQELNEAYAVLKDSARRQAYDASLRALEAPAPHVHAPSARVTGQYPHTPLVERSSAWWDRLQAEDQRERIARSECIMCGAPLQFLDRLAARRKHSVCVVWNPDERTQGIYEDMSGDA